MLAIMKRRTDFLLDFGTEVWRDEVAEWTYADLQKILDNFIEEGTGRKVFTLEVVDGEPKLTVSVKQSVCFIMPRGSSKTTLVNLDNLHDIVYQEENFFLYVSESGNHAERQLGTIKTELEDNEGIPNNELLNLVFGNFRPPRQSPLKWTEDYIETLHKPRVMVGAVGRGGQVRGFGKSAKRPGKIMFDDIEDEESVATSEQLKKASRWFFNAARPAKRKHTGRDIVTGTLLHRDGAILNKCIIHPEFTTIRFGAIDRQGDALWEWWMNLEAIEESKNAAAAVGELSGWYLEYMSEYLDDEAVAFPESKIIYLHRGKELMVATGLALDPAIDEKRTADMAALACVGIEQGGHKHVLETFGKIGMDSDAMLEKFFEFHVKWMMHLPPENRKYGIEAIAFQRVLIPMMRQKQVAKARPHLQPDGTTHLGYGQGAYFEVQPIFHGKIAKIPRVKGILKPLIWSGNLTFEEKNPDLHAQLVNWPGKLKDLPDVTAMAIALLDPYVLLGLDDPEEDEETGLPKPYDPEVEGQRLELVVGGDFRSAP